MRKEMFSVLLFSMLVLVLLSVPTQTLAKTFEWTVAASWEKTHPNNVPLLHFMETVNENCKTKDGNLEMKWVGGPETFKAQDLPTACSAGSLDFFHSSNLYYSGVVPQSDYTSLPYAWSFENASKMWHAGIHDLVDKAWQKKGIKVLSFQSLLGFYFFSTKPFTNLSDFEGKKLRVPGALFSFTPGYIGAVSTRLASAEVYGAMQRGMIDGGLQPLSSYVQYSYWEVAPYVLDHPLTIAGAWYWLNLKKFNSLPKSLQDKLLEIAQAEEAYSVNFWEQKHEEWKKIMNNRGVKFISFSTDDRRKFLESIMKLKEKLAVKVPAEESKILFEIYDRFAK